MSHTSKQLATEGADLQEGHGPHIEDQKNVAELASLAAKAVALAAAQAEAVAKRAVEHDAAKAADRVALAVIAAAEAAARAAMVAATEAKAAVEKAAALASRSARDIAVAAAQAVNTAKQVAARDVERALDEVESAYARASQSTERAAVAAVTEALAAVERATALASQSAHEAATAAEHAVAAAKQAVEQNAAEAATAVAEVVKRASEDADKAAAEMGAVVAKLDASEAMREQAELKIRLYVEQLERAMGATLRSVAIMVERRDPYTAGHERRVGELAAAIGVEMGLPAETVKGLRMTGYVHDIGKISVPAELLSKPSKLSPVEFELIKTHAQTGYDILKDVDFPWPLAMVILQHHERLDGSGYPQGLQGDEIIAEARIMAVADVVEAMQSHRPYRPGLGIEIALHEIEQNSGKFYDPQVVAACLRLFREKGYTLPN